METFVKALQEAERVGTKKEKFAALQGLSTTGKRLMVEALSPYRVFGIKKYPMPIYYRREENNPEHFLRLLEDLHNRQLTGNAAIEAVTATLSLYTEEIAKYLARVINKDLKAGFSQVTLNKIYPNLIPTFECMLAQKIDEKFDWGSGPWIVEAKYDGMRVIAVCRNEYITYYSRAGKIMPHLQGLFDEDIKKISKKLNMDIVVDGEVLGTSFSETMSARGEDNIAAKQKLKLVMFEVMSFQNWGQQYLNVGQAGRSDGAGGLVKCLALSNQVNLPLAALCRTKEEVEKFYQKVVKNGYEGVIIKKVTGMYEWKRSKNWIKWKPVNDVDLKIVGLEAGTKGTKNEHTLGNLVLEGDDENGNHIECNCGSGFSDELRDTIWENKSKYVGKTAKIEFQELTKAEGSESYSLRFPVFVEIRKDK